MELILIKIVVFLLALAGFAVAKHINKHKKNGSPLVCPVKFDCTSVIHSDYSKIFGISIENIGMVYYILASLGYFLLIFVSQINVFLVGILIFTSFCAFLFSLYLIFVQIFILKKGCSWCFTSAGICILIFIFNIYLYNVSYILSVYF